jgi:hypothetical protein
VTDIRDSEAQSIAAETMRAAALVQGLRDVPALRKAAALLIEGALATGCETLITASAAAEPLVTAAALISNGRLKTMDRQQAGGQKVLIVDAATVTGNNTRACAAELRNRGAAWVGAVILHRARPDLDELDIDPLLDYVAALQTL